MPSQSLPLNCDLGEGLDAIDAAIMPHIDWANIACGGHAGNENTMAKTLTLAKQHKVTVGAHPSYPDRKNFGRISMDISASALSQSLLEQVQALTLNASKLNIAIDYIKPHGALYNDCAKPQVLKTVISVAKQLDLPLMLLAGQEEISNACEQAGVKLIREAFADRRYDENGRLVARAQPDALLDYNESLQQVRQLQSRQVATPSGKLRPLICDTLCIHSDTSGAIGTAKAIKQQLSL